MTPHINAKEQDIAEVVLMPGDPLRAKWIAEKYLYKARVANDVRGMFAYTGYYNKRRITIMGHGMGIPSIGIYSHELFNFYNVKYIIRIGSAGSIEKDVKVGDVFVAAEAYSNSNYANDIGIKVTNKVIKCDPKLLKLAIDTAKESKIDIRVGRALSEDAFYSKYSIADLKKTKASVLEMEAFGLYTNAIKAKKAALTILTCSDSLITKESLSSLDRQTSFTNMANLGLNLAAKLAKPRKTRGSN